MPFKHEEKSIYENLISVKVVAVVSAERFSPRRHWFLRLNYVNDIQTYY
jgi:hypothetical protein